MLRRCSRHQTGWKYEQYAVPEPRYTYLFDWDPLDRMRWHNGPGINRVLAYTADGERIVERNLTSGVTTISLRGLDAKVLREVKLENGSYSWQKDYIYREGQLLASHGNNEPLQHYHLDHLGTPRMLSNRCGERLQRFESFPFGEAIAELPQHPEKMRLTGHQRDLNQPSTTEDDLDYMHARYYGTKMGRFLGVDLAGPDATLPRSWNRYAYARSNPLAFIDPDGLAERLAVFVTFKSEDFVPGYDLTKLRYQLSIANRSNAFSSVEVRTSTDMKPLTIEEFTTSLAAPGGTTMYLGHAYPQGLGPFPDGRFASLENVQNRNQLVVLGACDSNRFAKQIAPAADSNSLVVGFSGVVLSNQVANFAAVVASLLGQGKGIGEVLAKALGEWLPEKRSGLQFVLFGDANAVFGRYAKPYDAQVENVQGK